jgi:DEAD/DEAH box helicase domain-containing protein
LRGIDAVLEEWRRKPIGQGFLLDQLYAAKAGIDGPLPEDLDPALAAALRSRGIDRLYSHQAEAFEHARAGRDVVVATPTASGKSLTYNLPVLDRLARSGTARALYLFPTKALARDQEEGLRSLLKDAGLQQGAITYDGDTPGDARRVAREKSAILITNPDMLHSGILPHHASWARFFANLSYVVIDELHTYRGVFGSHLANVVRRLLRVAEFHGSSPKFLLSSATIGNPKQHAEHLIGRTVASIEESGAPSGARRVMLYDPPLVNRELGIRASYVKSAVRLAADLLRADVPTIVFGQSRNQVEMMLKYLRDKLAESGFDPDSIQAYRGGYLADTRRRIEHGLREGLVRGVVSTNALELGIDIGALDAVVCAGFPGSIASLWQRFGRAGRRRADALAIMVASSAPIDQYLARTPRLIVDSPIEEARIDPDNIEILLQHLKCASFELPFDARDPFGAVPPESVGKALGFLADNGVVHPAQKADGTVSYHWSSDQYPASHVPLRSASWDNFAIIDVERTKTIAEMDFRSAHTMLHEQAIYQHEGEQYQVERLDYDNHKAYVRHVEPDYFTTAMTHIKVNVLHEEKTAELCLVENVPLHFGLGDVDVVAKVVGFKKIKFHTHENVGYGEIQLPEMQLPTTALWMVVPPRALQAVAAPRAQVLDALRGIAHAMHTVAAVGLMTDPHDLGQVLVDVFERQEVFAPTIYLYDHVAGGIGLAPRLFEERENLVLRAFTSIARCACEQGCPACVGVAHEKHTALALARVLGGSSWT